MSASERRFSPEIQALRALAVGLVLLYHVSSGKLPPGGFVGVDVFFVISGYLITSHLMSSQARDGRIDLKKFYERRARRLLPAAFVVLAFVVGVTILFVPQSLWAENGRQVIASALYVENWSLAANSLTYAAPAADTSPVQHYWSLGVEEQFYVFWPLLLIGAVALSRRLGRNPVAGALGMMLVVLVVSLGLSIWQTSKDPMVAYFVSQTRVWELAAGGALSVIASRLHALSPQIRTTMALAGAALIVGAAFGIHGTGSFPGLLAVAPVSGAMLLLGAGDLSHARRTLSAIVRFRPIQWMGDISYSLYLWHWPLLILLPFILDRTLDSKLKLAVLPLSFIAADLSKRLVEDRFRPGLARRPWLPSTGSLAAAVVVATALVAFSGQSLRDSATQAREDAQRVVNETIADPPACFGAAARTDPGCDRQRVASSKAVPAPVLAGDEQILSALPGDCLIKGTESVPHPCTWKPEGAIRGRIALVGDSHAKQWVTPLRELASRSGYEITSYWKSGCPLSRAIPDGMLRFGTACADWVTATIDALEAGKYDAVLVSNFSALFDAGNTKAPAGLAAVWKDLTARGLKVYAIRDNPIPPKGGVADTPSCLARRDDPSACATKRDRSLLEDPQIAAQKLVPEVQLIDLTDAAFCDANGMCPSVTGGVIVYERDGHITPTYAYTLAPLLGKALRDAGLDLLSDQAGPSRSGAVTADGGAAKGAPARG